MLVFSILSLDTNADSMCIEAMSLFAAMYEQIEMGGFPEQLFPCSKVTHRLKNWADDWTRSVFASLPS